MLSVATVLGVLGAGLVVPRCAAADAIDNDDDRKHAAIENGEMSPLLPDVLQHSSFTRIAPVAQRLLLVAPFFAIAVRHRRRRCRHRPERRILEHESTVRWRLTASRLHQNRSKQFVTTTVYICQTSDDRIRLTRKANERKSSQSVDLR